jgi:hypothetical protein
MDLKEELKGTDDAFTSAIMPKKLNGADLKPFSLMRENAAIEIAKPPASIFRDAVIRAWVCTLEPKQVVEAMMDRVQATQAAFEWAEKQGYSFKNFGPLLELYKQLGGEIQESTNARSKNEGDEVPNAGGPQGS